MKPITLRNYESQKLMLLNPAAIVSVRVRSSEHPSDPGPLYLVIQQTNQQEPGLYFPVDENGDEDSQQTDADAALNNFRVFLSNEAKFA